MGANSNVMEGPGATNSHAAASEAAGASLLVEERFVRIRFVQATGQWACTKCPHKTFAKKQTAYKHVHRSHRTKARSKPVRTEDSQKKHERQQSVRTSRRYLVKKRTPATLGDVKEGTLRNTGTCDDASTSLVVGVVTCTGYVLKGGRLQRCKNKAIKCNQVSAERR